MMASRFDAYAASVVAEPRDILEALEGVTHGAEWAHLDRAPHGYAFGARLADIDGQVAQMWWGGRNALPHVSAQGEASHAVAGVLRECFPVHYVTRCDPIIVESMDPGAYDDLQGRMLEVAKARGVQVGTAGDHLLTMEGRTIYLGSPQSAVRVRLYDKAAELRATLKAPAKLAAVPPHYARMEAQIRPAGKPAREAAAVSPPEALWGSAQWLRMLVHSVNGSEVERFDCRETWRESDFDRGYWNMIRMCRRVLLEARDRAGSEAAAARQIFSDIEEFEARRGSCQ